jgi:hypothetical protein
MSSVAKPALAPSRPSAGVTFLAAWLVPGGGHFLQGQVQKAVVLFLVLTAMFTIGLGFEGRLFPFQFSEPLVFLAAIAEWAIGMPRVLGALTDAGRGNVVAAAYEYGNTFLITSGLLNMLAIFDAHDLATGRKRA